MPAPGAARLVGPVRGLSIRCAQRLQGTTIDTPTRALDSDAGRSPPGGWQWAFVPAVILLVLAVALYSRFGLDEELRRDEAVFAYAGQQLAEGVPPYASILDAKTPLASFVAGGSVAVGRAIGIDDLIAIRVVFFAIATLTVVAVFVAAALLFQSVAAGFAAGIAFLTFKGFAVDALGGPNAKTPGVLFAAVTTALLVHRQWFLAGICASLALLVWQPLAVYALVVVISALVLSERSNRWRSVAKATVGLAIPGIITLAYFSVAGALGPLIENAVLIPTVGRPPAEGDIVSRIVHIGAIVAGHYGFGGLVVWGGLASIALLVALRLWRLRSDGVAALVDPVLVVVGVPLACIAAMSLVDFQGYPDVYPLLPYAAFGIGGVVAAGLAWLDRGTRSITKRVAAIALLGAVVAATWAMYSAPRPEGTALRRQRAAVTRAERLLRPGDVVRVLGNPAPLVLMGRRNPSPAIYLSAGIDRWVVEHHPGGFVGWVAEITSGSDMVIIGGWSGDYLQPMRQALREEFELRRVRDLEVYLPAGNQEAALRHVAPSQSG